MTDKKSVYPWLRIRILGVLVITGVALSVLLTICITRFRLHTGLLPGESSVTNTASQSANSSVDEYMVLNESSPSANLDPFDDDAGDDLDDLINVDDQLVLEDDHEVLETDYETIIDRLMENGDPLIEETDIYAIFEIHDKDQVPTVQLVDFIFGSIEQPDDWMQAMSDRLIQVKDDPALRSLGAVFKAVLHGELTDHEIDALVHDRSVQTPLLAISAMEALGYWGAAHSVSKALRSTYSKEELRAFVNDPNATDDVRRQALLVIGTVPPTDLMELAVDNTRSVSLRMAALAKLVDEPSFDDTTIRQHAESQNDPVFQAMIRNAVEWGRLTKGVQPEELHTEEINEILDEDHSNVLMTVATLLRVHVGDNAANIHPETREYLFDTLNYYWNIPLTKEQEFWLRSLDGFSKYPGKKMVP